MESWRQGDEGEEKGARAVQYEGNNNNAGLTGRLNYRIAYGVTCSRSVGCTCIKSGPRSDFLHLYCVVLLVRKKFPQEMPVSVAFLRKVPAGTEQRKKILWERAADPRP
jgi:hypothetical protein